MTTSGEALVVDANDPDWYEGQHIAGAFNLPYKEEAEFEQYWMDFSAKVSRDQPLILYCQLGCMSKKAVAEQLRKLGYRDVRLMNEGPDEWEAAGYPVVRGRPEN